MTAASAAAVIGCAGATTGGAQALRTCVDRWNQNNMRGWGPALVAVAFRRVDAGHLREVGVTGFAQPHCVVALATEYRRDAKHGCAGGAAVARRPGYCVDRSESSICVLGSDGAYACPTNADTLRTPLRTQNGTTDARGVLTLATSLAGTHATPPLAWQRRYPHVDGYVEPWSSNAKLRAGLAFRGSRHGPCFAGSAEVQAAAALSCSSRPTPAVYDPCFAARPGWKAGDLAACSGPGQTTFLRWEITARH